MAIRRILVKRFIRRNVSFLIVVSCSVILLVCSIRQHGFFIKYNHYLSEIVFPIKKNIYSVIKYVQALPQAISISSQNLALMQENKQLKSEVLQLKQRKLGKSVLPQKNVIATQVLGYEQGVFNSSMLIRGTDKVNVGHVVSSDNGLVGLVTAITSDIALVNTITNKGIAVPVKTKQGLHLVLTGQNKNSMVSVAMQQTNDCTETSIPAIKVGDVLYTSGEGGVFKINIPVAKIVSIDHEIIAKPIVDLENLEYVYLSAPVLSKETTVNK